MPGTATIWLKGGTKFSVGYPGNTFPRSNLTGLWQAETLAWMATIAAAVGSAPTKTRPVDDLVKALKDNSRYSHCALFTYGTDDNAISGSTLYPLGGWPGLTNMTLFGAPARSTAGTVFGNLKYGTFDMPGFRALTDATLSSRVIPSTAAVANTGHAALISFGNSGTGGGAPNRQMVVGNTTAALTGETTSVNVADAGVTPPHIGAALADFTWGAGDDFVETWRLASGSNTSLRKNDTVVPLTLTAGTVANVSPASTGFVSDDTIYVNASRSSGTVTADTKASTRKGLLIIDTQAASGGPLSSAEYLLYRALLAAL